MATLIFYQRILYSRGWSCVSQHLRNIKPFFNACRLVFFGDAALCPVVGRSRPTVVASCTVCSGVFHHWIHHLWPQGPSPQALTLFGGVGFIARRLRRPEKRNADVVRGIFGTAYRVGLRPCDRTHLKNGLVPYSYVGGA